MASWRSSSDRSGRSSSPSSPLSPLPPAHSLPQWLRPSSRTSKAVVPPGRYKVLLAALTCIAMGWFMTSALSPSPQILPEDAPANTYIASTGVLNDPGRYGVSDDASMSSGLTDHRPIDAIHPKPGSEQSPSIKGALGDLHKAVTEKLHGWNVHGLAKDAKTGEKMANGTLLATPSAVNGSSNTTEVIHEGLSENERLGARTRIGKCTILFNGNSYWERAIRTHETHDRMHNYRLHVLRQHLLDDVWSKPAYILSLLLRELAKPEHERLEWLFWVDADTIILNPHVPIEVFLPPADFDDIHLMYSEDWNGLNNGVFPVRVNKWAVELFSAIITIRYYRPDTELTFRDQSAMNTLMRESKFAKNIMKLPQRWFNAYQGEHNETLAPYQIRRGDFLVHFAGVIDRQARMNLWLDRADQHADDWEVPLKSTSYIQEVKDFWSEQRVARQNHMNGISEGRLAASELLTKADDMMANFADRLSAEQIDKVKKSQEKLRALLGNNDAAEDLEKLNETRTALDDALVPLTSAKGESHKVLLSSAHDAIFAAEKDLLEAGFYRGVTSPDVNELDEAVKKLKEMVLTSEEEWNRAALSAAVDSITTLRGTVQERIAIVEAAAASASASAAAVAASAASALEHAAKIEEAATRFKEEQHLKALQAEQEKANAEAEAAAITNANANANAMVNNEQHQPGPSQYQQADEYDDDD